MSTKIAAKGAIIKHATTATPTVTLAGCREVSVTVGGREMINATTHDDTNTKTYIPAPLRDTNGVTFKLAEDPADTGHEAIRAAHAAGTIYYITVILPDAGAAQWAMKGVITEFSVPALNPETGLLESDVVFKADSVDTFTQ